MTKDWNPARWTLGWMLDMGGVASPPLYRAPQM